MVFVWGVRSRAELSEIMDHICWSRRRIALYYLQASEGVKI